MFQNALPAVVLLVVMIGVAWMLPRYRVVTVQLGEGEASLCLVLGVAPGGITALHSQPLPAADLADTPPGATPAASGERFAARLAQMLPR